MTKLIRGENIKGQLWITDTWYDIFCAKSCELTIEQDEQEVTSILSGSSREYLPGMSSTILSVQGITTLDNSESKIAITYLMQQSVRQQVLNWRVYLEAENGDTLEASFWGMIRTTTLTKEGFSYGKGSLVVRVSGDVNFSEIISGPATDFDYYSDYWQTVNGQNYISGNSAGESNASPVAYTPFALAATDTILEVAVEGIGFQQTEGTPGNMEYKFSTSPVRITFSPDLIFDGSQRVYVLIKRPV